MTILVLGASGFLGAWTVRALKAAGAAPVALVRPSSALARIDGLVDVLAVDEVSWPHAIADLRPSVVVSLDWMGVRGGSRDDPSQQENVARIRSTAQAASRAGAARFVGVGSQAEYGPRDAPVDEAAALAPVTAYGRAKVAAAEATRAVCAETGMDWVWARVFSTYGPLDHPYWLLPRVGDALMAGESVALTAGEQRWSYLYGPDAGAALAALATHADVHGVVNVGHPDAPRLRDTVETFATHFPGGGPLRFGAIPYSANQVMRLQPKTGRLAALGWRPSVALEDGLAETAAWLQGKDVTDRLTGVPLPRRYATQTSA
ncbi:NAD(P)-dependent oxidoreductase [Isoptericola sp. b441]|uniref:NAD(P)-dependent oxidoreductase n=1 Tax=Actinotalea lenta TaxID=3064654 RepID=A0ABT9DC75_9CELL|nr:NAD(P)-dependent oxidoreductase [Isoptericola sp. b441]MDO8108500.1 NAD(P)-dependent oxidoreductase [Isoptericola sp. b441]